MIWYFWLFLSLICGTLEEVIVIVKPEKIDSLVATFYRNLGFFCFTILVGLTGLLGKMSFVYNINFVILGLLWPLNSFAYDYFLRNIELSRFQGVLYTFPLLFLFIDCIFFHQSYSLIQIFGIVLVIFGSFIFSFDRKQKKFIFTMKGVLLLGIKMGIYAYLLITFQLLKNSINEVSFYFSIWVLIILLYLILLLLTKKYLKLKRTAVTGGFLMKTFASKGFDFLGGIFYLIALRFSTLTDVSALSALSPIILIGILLILSSFTKIKIAEDFSKQTIKYKILATAILTIGGFFVLYK